LDFLPGEYMGELGANLVLYVFFYCLRIFGIKCTLVRTLGYDPFDISLLPIGPQPTGTPLDPHCWRVW
jgi:hypothetical protein